MVKDLRRCVVRDYVSSSYHGQWVVGPGSPACGPDPSPSVT
jgi:hypothetical protein